MRLTACVYIAARPLVASLLSIRESPCNNADDMYIAAQPLASSMTGTARAGIKGFGGSYCPLARKRSLGRTTSEAEAHIRFALDR